MSSYDPKLLEAWFRFLAEAARSSGKSNELVEAMNRGGSTPDELVRIVSESGPEGFSPPAPDMFAGALERWAEALGFVPRSRHEALKEKYEELKAQMEEAERQARAARAFMGDAGREGEAKKALEAWSGTVADALELQAEWWTSFLPADPSEGED